MIQEQQTSVDLASCAAEPIRIPGAIQPHGVLLHLRAADLQIVQVSENTATHLGVAPDKLLGRTLEEAFSGSDVTALREALALPDPSVQTPVPMLLASNGAERSFDALPHRIEGGFIVELEPVRLTDALGSAKFLRRARSAVDRLQAAQSERELFDACAELVSDLTGFERVMVYRFDPDWNGEVVAEKLTADVDSYMGLHFPATDIPEQARALYAQTPLRIIPDSSYEPASLQPRLNPLTGESFDLSQAALRSVSPIHLEYLRNMNVGASMSISLMRGEQLWGLVACHHRAPRQLPYAVRAACELLGSTMSGQIGVQEEGARLRARLAAQGVQTRFFDVIATENSFIDALEKYAPALLEMMHAQGAAIATGKNWTRIGQTPDAEQLDAIAQWASPRAVDGIFHTDALPAQLPAAAGLKAIASGLLSVTLSTEGNSILFFRSEVTSTKTWAGNPSKAVEEGSYRLHPRKSFAAWEQTLTGQSLPWQREQILAAVELRNAFNALILQRTDRLLRRSAELEAKNTDLNSFAYIAAHDLKEPVRGIHHYASFVLEDYGAQLAGEGTRMLTTIQTLALKIEELLSSLLHFSAIGRVELAVKPVALDKVLDEALLMLATLISERAVEVRRPAPLPQAACDPVLMREVLVNLISNAIKYNDKPQPLIEITAAEAGAEQIISIRDNGIGIRDKYRDDVFAMFRRLHERDKFGGGTGAGLAIVKTIVEKHQGRVWLESEFGAGTTFHIGLPASPTS